MIPFQKVIHTIEIEIQGLDRNVDPKNIMSRDEVVSAHIRAQHLPQGPIFELATPIPRNDPSVLQLLHDHDRIKNTRNSSGS